MTESTANTETGKKRNRRAEVPGVYEDSVRGTFYFVVDIGRDPATGNRRQLFRRGFKSQTAAKKALKKINAESVDGDYVEPSSQPVRIYLEKWLASVAVNRKPSTAAMYAHKMRRYVIPRIGAMPLRAVEPATLDVLYDELLHTGGRNDEDGKPTPLSEQTVAVVHRILHRAFGDAVKRRIIRTNPAGDAEVPRSSAPQERNAWDATEMRTFLEYVTDDRLSALWVLFATTGIRRGEGCGVMWTDVQLDAGQLVVRRSRVPIAGTVVESKPKSGTRVVALAPATVAALRAHRKRQIAERLAWGEAWTDSGYVFIQEDGNPLRPDAVTRAFKEHVAAAGLRSIVLHGLRHSHATLGLAAGVPVKVMQERLGHAKIETTLGYTHSLPGMQESAAETVERLILG